MHKKEYVIKTKTVKGDNFFLYIYQGDNGYWHGTGATTLEKAKEVDAQTNEKIGPIRIPCLPWQMKMYIVGHSTLGYVDLKDIPPEVCKEFDIQIGTKCECGGDKLGIPHSSWCPKYNGS
jgi:hypothetical protein